MDAAAIDLLTRQIGRANAARKAAEALLEAKSLELYEASQKLRALNASLEESEARSRKLVEFLPEAILVQTAGRIAFANPAALRLLGAAHPGELLGSPLIDRLPAGHHAELADYLDAIAAGSAPAPRVLPLMRMNSEPVQVELMGIELPYNKAASVLLVARDITQRLQHEAALEHQVMHDALTGLPNRTLLRDRLALAIRRAERFGTQLGVMFLDLDGFKHINDSLGHSAGDALLIAIAERLADCVREYDTVARIGGDEFVLLIERVDDRATLSMLASRVLAVLSEPLTLLGKTHGITCSIGISTYPQDARIEEDLLKQADLAMYRAKDAGRNNFQFFTLQMQQRLNADLNLQRQLTHALERGEFLLHYQPQVSLRSGRIIGVEALIRWQSPELGLVPPNHFIPFAEESNLILGIGEWVLETACAQTRDWIDAGLVVVPVAINVAAKQFSHQRVDRLAETVLHRYRLDARLLELELTESMSMSDPEATIAWMQRLKALGVSIAIDDFGTGYSSLAYLKRFPIDRLKIDRAFISGLTDEPRDHAITTTVIRLAHSLGLVTVAEGVETVGQVRLLADEFCDEMQGYYFSRPLPVVDITRMLALAPCLDLGLIAHPAYRPTALVVGSAPSVLAGFAALLRGEEVELLTANGTAQAYEVLSLREIGVVICEAVLPGDDGMRFFARVKQLYPRAVCILLTGPETPPALGGAIGRGEVFRFIARPWDVAHVRAVLREAAARYAS